MVMEYLGKLRLFIRQSNCLVKIVVYSGEPTRYKYTRPRAAPDNSLA